MSKRIYQKNEYIIYEDCAEIVVVSDMHGIFKAKIDLEDVKRCKKHI